MSCHFTFGKLRLMYFISCIVQVIIGILCFYLLKPFLDSNFVTMLYDQEYVDYLPASITIGTNIYWAFYLIGIISLLLICNFHKTFMTIYAILLVILVLLFVMIHCAVVFASQDAVSNLDSVCNAVPKGLSKDCREIYNEVSLNTNFCTQFCPCYGYLQDFDATKYADKIFSSVGAKRVNQCDGWEDLYYKQNVPDKNLLTFLNDMETEEKCSGLCFTPLFYYMSDSSKGTPSKNCDTSIKDYIDCNIYIYIYKGNKYI